eukprot:13438336-Alexandrium_andersonii.AAC.1
MSASLVGSEMCIRDSFKTEETWLRLRAKPNEILAKLIDRSVYLADDGWDVRKVHPSTGQAELTFEGY